MDRLACVDVPALPLQVLLRRHEDWRLRPVAVIDRDAANGTVLCVNESARAQAVLPGASFASALALCGALNAGEVAGAEIDAAVQALIDELRRFSPHIEPKADEHGVFWLDVAGLERLHPSRAAWAKRMRAALVSKGFDSAVVVGRRRFSTYAIAKSLHGSRALVFDDATKERAAADKVALRRLALEPRTRHELEQLGLSTLGDFLRLPVESVHVRFGEQLARLHRMASGELHVPLEPQEAPVRSEAALDLDDPLVGVDALLQVVAELVQPLLVELARSGRAVKSLAARLALEDKSDARLELDVAEPTLDLALLLRLLRLRLEQTVLARGAERVEVELHAAPASAEQLELFAQAPRRDPRAAARCFAALRAALGESAVVRAELAPAHLPEASFRWAPLRDLSVPRPREIAEPPLMRRFHAKALPLSAPQRNSRDGWMPRGAEHGAVARLDGPYLLSGGWWRTPVERDYYFVHFPSGAPLWIYFDRRRRRWFWQGTVS